jgi:hypothetical protein
MLPVTPLERRSKATPRRQVSSCYIHRESIPRSSFFDVGFRCLSEQCASLNDTATAAKRKVAVSKIHCISRTSSSCDSSSSFIHSAWEKDPVIGFESNQSVELKIKVGHWSSVVSFVKKETGSRLTNFLSSGWSPDYILFRCYQLSSKSLASKFWGFLTAIVGRALCTRVSIVWSLPLFPANKVSRVSDQRAVEILENSHNSVTDTLQIIGARGFSLDRFVLMKPRRLFSKALTFISFIQGSGSRTLYGMTDKHTGHVQGT